MKRQSRHVYAVIRVNEFQSESRDWDVRITVKEVVMTKDEACREVERLNEVNKKKRVFYFWQLTRMVER